MGGVFGLGFGEMVLILIVGIVVVGPRNLPTLMRTAGQWVAKLRRLSTELRSQSGIDELIRQEGLEKEIQELRALSRVNVIDTLVATAAPAAAAPRPAPSPSRVEVREPLREREYPLVGCDAGGAVADDVSPYVEPVEPQPVAKVAVPDAETPAPPQQTSAAVNGERAPTNGPAAS